MFTWVLERGRALASCGCASLAIALSGCVGAAIALAGCAGAGGSSVTASGTTLTIYASAPAPAASQAAQDVLDAEQLAFEQEGGVKIGKFTLRFAQLHGRQISDDARRSIEDSSTVAYLGELEPHASYASLGITNAADVLQVTPADTALELTQTTGAVANSPNTYYEALKTYGRTFARVVPSTALEAKAQVQEMQALGVKRLYVADDGSEYGKAIALAVKAAAPPQITVVGAQAAADAVFDGASSKAAAARAFNQAIAGKPAIKLFAPSALDDSAFAAMLLPAPRNLYISSPGFLTKNLTPSGRQFVADFRTKYGHAPASGAIFGYEAMAAVLAVVREAGSSASNRGTLVRDFFSIKNRQSVLGTYSIRSSGDTSLGPFVFSRLKNGQLVPYRSVQIQG